MAAVKGFRNRSGMWDGVTRSRASEVDVLRGRLIICLEREFRELFRADMAGLERVQMRSFSPGRRVLDASGMATQITFSSIESTLNVLGRWMRQEVIGRYEGETTVGRGFVSCSKVSTRIFLCEGVHE